MLKTFLTFEQMEVHKAFLDRQNIPWIDRIPNDIWILENKEKAKKHVDSKPIKCMKDMKGKGGI